MGFSENKKVFFVSVGCMFGLDVALLVQCAIGSNRSHAPWDVLLVSSAISGCLIVLFSTLHYMSEVTRQATIIPTQGAQQYYDRRDAAFLGESFAAVITAVGLTAAALWAAIATRSAQAVANKTSADTSATTTLFTQYDIWVPLAIGAQGVALAAMAKVTDALLQICEEQKGEATSGHSHQMAPFADIKQESCIAAGLIPRTRNVKRVTVLLPFWCER